MSQTLSASTLLAVPLAPLAGSALAGLFGTGIAVTGMVILTGYQAPGTRGARIANGEKTIRIHGQDVRIGAEVVQLSSASAHADADQTLAWLRRMPHAPQQVYVVHGEIGAADTLRQRPDVQAQEHRVQAALANLSAQERANFPTLRLSGSLGVSALTLGALSDGASVARSIAASLAAPIFDAGANRAQIAAQQAAVVQARQAYRSSVLAALQEVEDALVQLQSDQQRLVHVQVAAEAAGNAQRLAQQRYDSGLIDFRTVLESQRSLLSSQDSLASAQAAISTDVVKLFKALGGGWTKENNQLTDENLVSQAVSATE